MSLKLKVCVFGGNGYIGQNIIKHLLKFGCTEIVSINRSGKPKSNQCITEINNNEKIKWHKGDVFDSKSYQNEIKDADGCISVIGAFGSNDFMEKINGDANIKAIDTAYEMNSKRFVFISCVENNLPEFVLKGYFNGKKRAELELLKKYNSDNNGIILKPSFVSGTRFLPIGDKVYKLPLGLFGKPMQFIFSLPLFNKLHNLPFMKAILTKPIDIDVLANIAAKSSIGKLTTNKQILNVDDMNNEFEKQ